MIAPPSGLDSLQWRFIGVLIWILSWWATEAVPIPVTSLIPIVAFPLMGILPEKQVTAQYGHPIIFLFMGGFFIAASLEKWNIHRRFAMYVLHITGQSPMSILAGLMGATALISMWISNTATTLMMVAIGLALLHYLKDLNTPESEIHLLGKAFMLAIAYSASIGGVGTLVGTPPNLFFASFYEATYGIKIGMLTWMKIGIPFMLVMLPLAWMYLVFVFKLWKIRLPEIKDRLRREVAQLPQATPSEKIVTVIFLLTCALWILSLPLSKFTGLPISDTGIALFSAILLLSIPISIQKRTFLLDWETAVKIPWGILLMFGAGLSIAAGFEATQLQVYVAGWLLPLSTIHPIALIAGIATIGLILTELLTNSSAIATFLPIAASISTATGIPPLYLMIPVTIAISGGFMLPIATPPNAIVFGTRLIPISDMLKIGFVMNILTIIVIILLAKLGVF